MQYLASPDSGATHAGKAPAAARMTQFGSNIAWLRKT